MNNPMYDLRNMTVNEWLNQQPAEVQQLFNQQLQEIVLLRTKLQETVRHLNSINSQLIKVLNK